MTEKGYGTLPGEGDKVAEDTWHLVQDWGPIGGERIALKGTWEDPNTVSGIASLKVLLIFLTEKE